MVMSGDVKHVDAEVLVSLISRGVVPVMAPLTHDGEAICLIQMPIR